jgi:lipoprotein NlpI
MYDCSLSQSNLRGMTPRPALAARTRAVLTALLLACLAPAARADDADDCAHARGDAQAACTRVIKSGRFQGHRLAAAYNNRSLAKRDKGDLDGAISDYTRAIELDPNYVLAYRNRGDTKQQKSDLDGAIADYNRALELDPKYAIAYNNRGIAKQAKRDPDGAISDYTRAIELDPDYAIAYRNRGDAKQQKSDPDGAIADYNRAIELDPKYVYAYGSRGYAQFLKGGLDAAIADYTRAIELDPKYAPPYNNRGQITFLKGDPAGAISDLARAQELNPGYAYTSLWLYLARSRAGQDSKEELSANAAKLDGAKWPAPVVALYQGKGTPESVMAAAKSTDPKTEKEQVCEANFYVAEWQLLKNDQQHALPLLRAAAEQCPRNFREYSAAALELKRLAAK